MTELYTGHEAEMAAEREMQNTPYSKEQRAIDMLRAAIGSLNPTGYLDFLPPPTAEDMIENAIRYAQTAINLLRGQS